MSYVFDFGGIVNKYVSQIIFSVNKFIQVKHYFCVVSDYMCKLMVTVSIYCPHCLFVCDCVCKSPYFDPLTGTVCVCVCVCDVSWLAVSNSNEVKC